MCSGRMFVLALAAVPLSLTGILLAQTPSPSTKDTAPIALAGSSSQECASCHRDIANEYSRTAMATASGAAKDAVITGEFDHKESQVHYRVYQQVGKVWMSYEREGKDGIQGKKELEYYIGSGKKGRTYLFSEEGFWFEAPINWYSQEKRWNMTPAYVDAERIPLNLPAYPDCLNCHTSGMRPPLAGTDSKYAGEPFAHGGISCQRCHGSGDMHAGGKGPIVNPAKLPPEQRDSICMECHFEGTVAVQQPEKHLYEFQPGERLSDYMHYFVVSELPKTQTPQALSQFEALSQSTCKKQSGDKMWCGSCHDAHSEPAEKEKAAYYRGKCIACHGEAFARQHHADKADCTHCHMPELPAKDVAHTETTDHRILRYPNEAPLPQLQLRGKPLKAFPVKAGVLTTTRDYALAWESLAQRDWPGASRFAEEYLQQALKERPDDSALLTAMGFVAQKHGRANDARGYYEHALKVNPLASDAATDLGILEAEQGNLRRAVVLWNSAFLRVPNRSAIGMNLAMAFCVSGQKEVARQFVERVLEFNPDYAKGKSLLQHLSEDPAQCKP